MTEENKTHTTHTHTNHELITIPNNNYKYTEPTEHKILHTQRLALLFSLPLHHPLSPYPTQIRVYLLYMFVFVNMTLLQVCLELIFLLLCVLMYIYVHVYKDA